MLKGARLVANVSQDEYPEKIERLTNINVPYVPKVEFGKPVGISHQMQAAKQGVWIPQTGDPESVGDGSEQAVEPAAAADDQIVHGSFSVGGSSGSGRQQVDSSHGQQLIVHSSPDVARLKSALSSELSL